MGRHEDEHSLKHSLKPAIWRFSTSHGPLNHPFLFGSFHEINQLAIGIPTIFFLKPIHWIRGWNLTKAQRQDLRPAIAGCHAAGCQRETLIMIEVGPCQQWSNGELTWNILWNISVGSTSHGLVSVKPLYISCLPGHKLSQRSA